MLPSHLCLQLGSSLRAMPTLAGKSVPILEAHVIVVIAVIVLKGVVSAVVMDAVVTATAVMDAIVVAIVSIERF